MPNAQKPAPDDLPASFRRRVRYVILMVLAATVLALLAWWLKGLFLLGFTAAVIATLLHGIADPLVEKVGLPHGWAVGLAAAFVLALLIGVVWLFGREVSVQLAQLSETLPLAWEQLRGYLAQWPGAAELMRNLSFEALAGRVAAEVSSLATRLGWIVSGTFTTLVHTLLVPFAGLYLALEPGRYRDGALQLVPPGPRERLAVGLNKAGRALKLWLLGQLAVMAIVGALVGLGAWIIGLPSPLILGLFAGLAEFVPFVGPVVAAVPGILLGFTIGPQTALWALLLYVVVQQLESYVFTPLIQRHMVLLPPVLTLFAVLAMGAIFGPLGLVLAMPLTVFVYVLTKVLYIRQALGEETSVPGEDRDHGAEDRDRDEGETESRADD